MLTAIFSVIAMNTFAQEPYFQTTPPIKSNNNATLAAEDFSKQATAIKQQHDAAVQQELNQRIAKLPKPVFNPPAIIQSSEPPSSTNVESQTTTTQTTTPSAREQYSQPSQYQSETTPQAATAPAPQQQGYTGFIAPTPPANATQGTSGGNSGGGWNIKY